MSHMLVLHPDLYSINHPVHLPELALWKPCDQQMRTAVPHISPLAALVNPDPSKL